MWLKLWGGLVVIVISTSLGYLRAMKFRNRTKQLAIIKQALRRLDTEIRYGFTPLPIALEHVSHSTPYPIQLLFTSVANRLATPGHDVNEAWQVSLDQCWQQFDLHSAERQIMSQFGSSLGISDAVDQSKHIDLAIQQIDRMEVEAMGEQLKYEKMWNSLGFMFGILLFILLY